MDRVEAVVVGAGAVGLAIARALALAGREVIVLEAAEAIGTGTSSRNSEVIHAGIYYPAGSLKAALCVAGKPALYAYCRDRGVAAPNLGKLIVAATPEQIPDLLALRAKAAANGVADLRLIEAAEARALEPNLVCAAALVSPSTGIVDSHGFMLALEGDLEAAGGVVALHTPVERLIATDDGIVVQAGGAAPCDLRAGLVVNAAGLGACALGRATQGLDPARVPQDYLCKGHYFSLVGVKAPFGRLVYPLPEQAGLGIHATVDLGGQVRFGPDVLWTDTLDYSPASGDAARFYAAIRAYWPGLPDGALQPTYTGIRPKIVGPGAPAADFVIDGPADHGIAGLVNLFGIESPGLTASLAIADHVAALVSARQPRRAIA